MVIYTLNDYQILTELEKWLKWNAIDGEQVRRIYIDIFTDKSHMIVYNFFF